MISRTSAQVTANPAAQAESRRAAEPVLPGEGQALTSHTWTLSSGGVSLDFTYRRLENLPGAAGRLPAPAAQPAAAPVRAAVPAAPRRPTFQEYLRREQLAQLLVEPSRPPRDRESLFTAKTPAQPLAGPVCRAYAQALGPLAESGRSYTA